LWHFLSHCRNGFDSQFHTAKQMLKPLPPNPQTTAGE